MAAAEKYHTTTGERIHCSRAALLEKATTLWHFHSFMKQAPNLGFNTPRCTVRKKKKVSNHGETAYRKTSNKRAPWAPRLLEH